MSLIETFYFRLVDPHLPYYCSLFDSKVKFVARKDLLLSAGINKYYSHVKGESPKDFRVDQRFYLNSSLFYRNSSNYFADYSASTIFYSFSGAVKFLQLLQRTKTQEILLDFFASQLPNSKDMCEELGLTNASRKAASLPSSSSFSPVLVPKDEEAEIKLISESLPSQPAVALTSSLVRSVGVHASGAMDVPGDSGIDAHDVIFISATSPPFKSPSPLPKASNQTTPSPPPKASTQTASVQVLPLQPKQTSVLGKRKDYPHNKQVPRPYLFPAKVGVIVSPAHNALRSLNAHMEKAMRSAWQDFSNQYKERAALIQRIFGAPIFPGPVEGGLETAYFWTDHASGLIRLMNPETTEFEGPPLSPSDQNLLAMFASEILASSQPLEPLHRKRLKLLATGKAPLLFDASILSPPEK